MLLFKIDLLTSANSKKFEQEEQTRREIEKEKIKQDGKTIRAQMKLDTELKKQEAELEKERMKQEGQNKRERSRFHQDRFKQIFDQYSWKCLQTIKGYGSKKNKNSRTRV